MWIQHKHNYITKSSIEVEGDNQGTISALKGGPFARPFHDPCVADILALSASFIFIQFLYSPRATNRLAHNVAKEAFSAPGSLIVWMEDVPSHLAFIAFQDDSHVYTPS